jgi:hypothetical protein
MADDIPLTPRLYSGWETFCHKEFQRQVLQNLREEEFTKAQDGCIAVLKMNPPLYLKARCHFILATLENTETDARYVTLR